MTLKTIQYAALSILLHGIVIFALVSFTSSNQKLVIKNKPIKSYLFFNNPTVVLKPVENPTAILDGGTIQDQDTNKTEISAQLNILEEIKLKIDSVAKNTLDKEKATSPDIPATISFPKIQTAISEYIQNLHLKELGTISESSLNDFRKSKPLTDKSTPLSTNQRLKALSSSFAPRGSDIIVLSEFGPDETTIMLGDSCFTITQTALNDKVWKGSSVWTQSDSCGKYDKYDGQLQKSLNKYLQK